MKHWTYGILAVAIWAGSAVAGPHHEVRESPPGPLDRLKGLVGDWVAAEDGEMMKKGDLVSRFRLTGAGTAVVEEIFPGTEHSMTTVYHLDGEELVLTHYCMEGNQPRMRGKAVSPSRVEFRFDGGTNVDPSKDTHVHEGTIDFVGKDEIRSAWIEHAGGKPAQTIRMHLVRRSS